MSEYEGHIGKLVEVEVEDLEDFAKEQLKIMNEDKDDFYDSYLEQLLCLDSYGFVFSHGKLYKVTKHKEFNYSDIAHSSKNADGSIDFVLYYYNGGAGFDEVLKEALTNMEKE